MYSSVVGKPLRTKEQQEVWSGTPRGEEAMTYLGSSMNMRRRYAILCFPLLWNLGNLKFCVHDR